jgi:uncharacterized coiled-coil protein SlyX
MKAQEAINIAENITKTSKSVTDHITGTTADKRGADPSDERQNRADSSEGMLQKLYTLLKNTYHEMKNLKDVIGKQGNTIQELQKTTNEQHTTIQELQEHLKQLHEQLDVITSSRAIVAYTQASPHPSYAEVARTPPTSYPSNLPSHLSIKTTPSAFTDALYCTIDTSQAAEEHKPKMQVAGIRETIEKEMRAREGQEKWRLRLLLGTPRRRIGSK